MKIEVEFPSRMAIEGKVFINGEDITKYVRGVTVSGRYDNIATVQLDILPDFVEIKCKDPKYSILFDGHTYECYKSDSTACVCNQIDMALHLNAKELSEMFEAED
jgi:hypothetical protein